MGGRLISELGERSMRESGKIPSYHYNLLLKRRDKREREIGRGAQAQARPYATLRHLHVSRGIGAIDLAPPTLAPSAALQLPSSL